MSEIYSALEQARLRREQQLGNLTREARVHLTYDTNGVGETTTAAALDFGCAFILPPTMATGVVATAFPDTTMWRYPVVTAGVWKWQTKRGSDPASPLYTGAWLFFNVQCEPRINPRTDGSEFEYLTNQLNQLRHAIQVDNDAIYRRTRQQYDLLQQELTQLLPGTEHYEQAYLRMSDLAKAQASRVAALGGDSATYISAVTALHDAQQVQRLQRNPPTVGLTHHLSFSGLATQAYSLDSRFLDSLSPVPVQF